VPAEPEDPAIFYRDPTRSREALRRIGHDSIEAALDYLYGEAMRRPLAPETYAEARRIYAPEDAAPGEGKTAGEVLEEVRRRIFPHSMNAHHPRTFCYFTAPPPIMAVMGDMIASVINQGVDIWRTGPVAAFTEEELIRWMCRLTGYGPGAFGILTSGGMHANLTALKVARDRKLPRRHESDSTRRARLYASEQAHFSVERSLDVLGLPPETTRRIPVDERLRMRPDAFEAAIREDERAGLIPFCVVATAGTTSSGSVDPLEQIARIGSEHGLWLHADAAYGGAVRISERHRERVRGLELYDSVTLDPHKWLFQPHDIGAVLVKRRDYLLDSFRSSPEYYRTGRPDEEPLHWYQFGIEGSRRFRGLKLWMTWKHLGTTGLGDLIDRNMSLAAHLAQRIQESDDFEALPPAPDLSVVCFRHLPSGKKESARRDAPDAALDAHQDRLQRALELSGEGWVSTTRLRDATWLRAGIVNYLSVPADADALLDSLRRLGREPASRPIRRPGMPSR
jgi:glutamate/tyrosine decarboxylase-like PLP-dependent enzyme